MERDETEWERMRRAFFPRPAAPTAEQTGRFVAAVMARIPKADPVVEQPFWAAHRWFVPALGFSFAAFAFSLVWTGSEAEDPATALLLADAGGGPAAEFMARPDAGTPEAVLGLALEER